MASNYPVIRLAGSDGITRFAQTFNWAPGVVASGSTLVSTDFMMPAGAPNVNGLQVIANGIASAPVLYINGTGGNDTITLDTGTILGLVDLVTVNVDGTTSAWFTPGLSAVFVNTGSGNVTVNVNDTWGNIPTFIDGGGGADTINIGMPAAFRALPAISQSRTSLAPVS
jgi:hypothetical protein